jgi:RNA polymerase sigma factor (sigma-70 family)
MTGQRIGCDGSRAPQPSLGASMFARRDDLDALVHRAAAGEQRAWTLLIHRFDATIRSVARQYGLIDADRDEVAQRTWLALYRHIGRLRSHPAVGGWLVTTARRESLKILAAARREVPVGEPQPLEPDDAPPPETRLMEAEQRAALRRALEDVPEHERRLMQVMLREPAPSYDEISEALGIPKGSIGPTRGRCVARLRGDERLVCAVRGTARRPLPGHDLA